MRKSCRAEHGAAKRRQGDFDDQLFRHALPELRRRRSARTFRHISQQAILPSTRGLRGASKNAFANELLQRSPNETAAESPGRRAPKRNALNYPQKSAFLLTGLVYV